jgi:hypothetical protein
MKSLSFMFTLLLGCVPALTMGCATSSTTTAVPSAQIDVFRDGATPNRPFKELRVLKDDGKAIEQAEIEAKMMKQAKKMGGNAIIFEKPLPSGQEFDFSGLKLTYLYKGRVIVYQ